jgi:hypothetical protein
MLRYISCRPRFTTLAVLCCVRFLLTETQRMLPLLYLPVAQAAASRHCSGNGEADVIFSCLSDGSKPSKSARCSLRR